MGAPTIGAAAATPACARAAAAAYATSCCTAAAWSLLATLKVNAEVAPITCSESSPAPTAMRARSASSMYEGATPAAARTAAKEAAAAARRVVIGGGGECISTPRACDAAEEDEDDDGTPAARSLDSIKRATRTQAAQAHGASAHISWSGVAIVRRGTSS